MTVMCALVDRTTPAVTLVHLAPTVEFLGFGGVGGGRLGGALLVSSMLLFKGHLTKIAKSRVWLLL